MNDFITRVKRVKEHREHKINNALGVYDAYKWLRKNKWLDVGSVPEHDYYAIIRTVNKVLISKFLTTGLIRLPERMGDVVLRKYPSKITINKGKVQTNLPIDWNATLKLWSEDKESYKNKVLIKREEKEIFKILYDKSKALYNNKSFYNFNLNRSAKIALKRQLKNGKLDAFMLCGKI